MSTAKFRIGKLPPTLEELATKYSLDHEEVAIDAIYAFAHYRNEQGQSDMRSYNLVLNHLDKKYELYRSKGVLD